MPKEQPNKPIPIRVRTDLFFGQKFWIENEEEQNEHRLVGLEIRPGETEGQLVIKYILDYCGDEYIVYDFLCSNSPDQLKKIKNTDKDEDP